MQCPLIPEESFVFGGVPISQTREIIFKEFHTAKPKSLSVWFQNPLPYIHPRCLTHALCETVDTEGDLMRPLIWFSPQHPAILWYLGSARVCCHIPALHQLTGCPRAAHFISEPSSPFSKLVMWCLCRPQENGMRSCLENA